MYILRSGVVFDIKLGTFMDSPTFGVKEEYSALSGDRSISVKGILCLDKAGRIIAPSILRNGQFYDLETYLRQVAKESMKFGFDNFASSYSVHLDSFTRSNKPTLAMIDNVFFIVNFKGKFDKATGMWDNNSTIDLYQIHKIVDIPTSVAPREKNGTLKKGVLCYKILPKSRENLFSSIATILVADNLYNTYINKFKAGLVYYMRMGISRRGFLNTRIQEFYVK